MKRVTFTVSALGTFLLQGLRAVRVVKREEVEGERLELVLTRMGHGYERGKSGHVLATRSMARSYIDVESAFLMQTRVAVSDITRCRT